MENPVINKPSINRGMFTSATDEWETPQLFFNEQNEKYGPFDIDVCADANNAKCSLFFTKEQNGLLQEWKGKCWMNPPYGKQIKQWMKKAYESSQQGATVVCLVPARTDTGWWHDYAVKGEIIFVRGRLKFGGATWNAPFPSALIVFNPTFVQGEP